MSYYRNPESDLRSLLQIQKYGQQVDKVPTGSYLPGKAGYGMGQGVTGYSRPQQKMDQKAIEAEDRRLRGLRQMEKLMNRRSMTNAFNHWKNYQPDRYEQMDVPEDEEPFQEELPEEGDLSRGSSKFNELPNLPYAQPEKETSYANYWLQKKQGKDSPKLSPFYRMMLKDEYRNMEDCRDPFNCTEGAYIGLKSKLGEKFTKPFKEHIGKDFEDIYAQNRDLEESELLKKLYTQEQDNRFSYLGYNAPKNYYLVPRNNLKNFVEEDDALFMKHNDPKAHITRVRGALDPESQKQLQSQWIKKQQGLDGLRSFPIETFVGKKEPKISAKMGAYNFSGYGKFANEYDKEPMVGVGTTWSSKPSRPDFQQYRFPPGTTEDMYRQQQI